MCIFAMLYAGKKQPIRELNSKMVIHCSTFTIMISIPGYQTSVFPPHYTMHPAPYTGQRGAFLPSFRLGEMHPTLDMNCILKRKHGSIPRSVNTCYLLSENLSILFGLHVFGRNVASSGNLSIISSSSKSCGPAIHRR